MSLPLNLTFSTYPSAHPFRFQALTQQPLWPFETTPQLLNNISPLHKCTQTHSHIHTRSDTSRRPLTVQYSLLSFLYVSHCSSIWSLRVAVSSLAFSFTLPLNLGVLSTCLHSSTVVNALTDIKTCLTPALIT